MSRIRGRLTDAGRWRGTFKLRSALRRNGRLADRCRVGTLRWRTRPG